jgi:asparagine synthase (glutamine-hydrolysing)
VLAAAASAAHRFRLAPPVAVTMRYDSPETEEGAWQEAVVRHVGVKDWVIIRPGDGLDLLGDIALTGLRAHGARFPPNAHSMVLPAAEARQGSLVTGIGGDLVLGSWRWRRRTGLLRGSVPPSSGAVLNAGLAALPAPARRAVTDRMFGRQMTRPDFGLSWLTPRARQSLRPWLVADRDQPTNWPAFLRWAAGSRASNEVVATVALLASDSGAQAHAPLLDRGFLASLARTGGRLGFSSRTAAMAAIAGDRLPADVIGRSTKAFFHNVFFGPRSRAFARAWDGSGVDRGLVDIEALRREWLSPVPDFRSMLLVHHLWSEADRVGGGPGMLVDR